MLDVAGGSGIYSTTFAQRQPTLRATVFDLPTIVRFAQEIIARYGMQERVRVYPGNYLQDDFAGGNDLVLLSNSLQTEGVTTCRMLLGKVFKARAPGGQLVIHIIRPHLRRQTDGQRRACHTEARSVKITRKGGNDRSTSSVVYVPGGKTCPEELQTGEAGC